MSSQQPAATAAAPVKLFAGDTAADVGDNDFDTFDDDADFNANPLASATASATVSPTGMDAAKRAAAASAGAGSLASAIPLALNDAGDAEFAANKMTKLSRRVNSDQPEVEARKPLQDTAGAGSVPTTQPTVGASGAAGAANPSAGPSVKPSGSDRASIYFNTYVFLCVFVCVVCPFLGIPLYKRLLLPEVKAQADQRQQAALQRKASIGRNVLPNDGMEEDDDDEHRGKHGNIQHKNSSAATTASASAANVGQPPAAAAPIASVAKSDAADVQLAQVSRLTRALSSLQSGYGSSGGSEEPHFEWTWASAQTTILRSFPLIDQARAWWNADAATVEQVRTKVLRVLKADKKYLMHPMWLPVAEQVLWGMWGLMLYFFAVDEVHLSLQSSLLYAMRFHLCAAAAFAAVLAMHSSGGVPGYKAVQATREAELEKLNMRFVMLPTPAEIAQGVVKPSKPHKATALGVLRSIDAMSKLNKEAMVERRMVWIFCVCVVRALVGVYAAHSSGTASLGMLTSLLYGVFHLLSGFCFFALAVQTEFELHDDHRRWKVFSSLHSAPACAALKLPFYVPLAHFGRSSNNIQGWYAVRCFLKDLKGKFDFSRLECMVVCIVVQLAMCAGLPLCYSYFTLGQSVAAVFEHVLGSNPLVGFDVALCLVVLLDMVSAGVQINRFCSSHQVALQEQEMQRSFALTNPEARQAIGGEQLVADSIHQLKALREKLMLCRESEKLRIYGFVLDEHIITYIRTALVSYGLVAVQSVFAKQVMHEKPAQG